MNAHYRLVYLFLGLRATGYHLNYPSPPMGEGIRIKNLSNSPLQYDPKLAHSVNYKTLDCGRFAVIDPFDDSPEYEPYSVPETPSARDSP